MHYTPLDGPKFALRTPRVTPWSHVYWKYASCGDLEAIKEMYAKGVASPYDLNPRGSSALLYAASSTNFQLSQFLIEQGADSNLPNDRGRLAGEFLWESSFAGDFEDEGICMVKNMLKDTDSTEAFNFSTLHKIVLGMIWSDLRSELETSTACANLRDHWNRTPLCWATIRDDLEAVKTLLYFDADPNIQDAWGHPRLGFARSSAVCQALLSSGADVTIRRAPHNYSALHCACYDHGTVEVVDLLVDAGIPVDVRDAKDKTPLNIAIMSQWTSAAQRLVELGADVNALNATTRQSPIHLAVSFNHYEIIPLLLSKGVDYTATDIDGRNIAHMAAGIACLETIDVLAESNLGGLDVLLKDNYGTTPADYLAEREIFGKNETGVHEAFEAFVRSVSLPEGQ